MSVANAIEKRFGGLQKACLGKALQSHRFAIAAIDKNLRPFARRQGQTLDRHRLLEKAPVGRNLIKRTMIGEAQIIRAGVRPIEKSKANQSSWNLEMWIERSIDQQRVAIDRTLSPRKHKLSLVVKATILEYKREIVDSIALWNLQ